jgi:arabinose-5-phosphate isomerase
MEPRKPVEAAKQTILLEADAIKQLAEQLTDDFSKVVDIILKAKGRLIVSGIGKSAVIAQKLVATLNSTGTPSAYLHAADAIHGDLGMILPDDVVLIISKSGDTPEIKVLTQLIKSFGNQLVAMVGNLSSYLALKTKRELLKSPARFIGFAKPPLLRTLNEGGGALGSHKQNPEKKQRDLP